MMRKGETLEEWRARMEAKRQAARRFSRLATSATASQEEASTRPARQRKRPPAKQVTHCVGCGCEVYKDGTPPAARANGAKRLMGRGLCSTCYFRDRKKGEAR